MSDRLWFGDGAALAMRLHLQESAPPGHKQTMSERLALCANHDKPVSRNWDGAVSLPGFQTKLGGDPVRVAASRFGKKRAKGDFVEFVLLRAARSEFRVSA